LSHRPLVVLSLRRSFVVLRRMVVAMPLVALPSRPLVMPPSRSLIVLYLKLIKPGFPDPFDATFVVGEEQPQEPCVAIGACKMEPPPGADMQYEPDVADLALPHTVIQQPRHVIWERLIVQHRAPKGGVGASGQGWHGGRGGALLLRLPGGSGGRGQQC
jgi:hypothetical protein